MVGFLQSNSKNIKFGYTEFNLPKDIIYLSASLKPIRKDKNEIEENIRKLKDKKENSQPLRVKTGGSTFKNPINQSTKKVYELINESIDSQVSFGDAKISEKHSNFFINSKNASFENMLNLINFVKSKIKKKKPAYPLSWNWKLLNNEKKNFSFRIRILQRASH